MFVANYIYSLIFRFVDKEIPESWRTPNSHPGFCNDRVTGPLEICDGEVANKVGTIRIAFTDCCGKKHLPRPYKNGNKPCKYEEAETYFYDPPHGATDADAMLFVFDATRLETLDRFDLWKALAHYQIITKRHLPVKQLRVFVMANKIDLLDSKDQECMRDKVATWMKEKGIAVRILPSVFLITHVASSSIVFVWYPIIYCYSIIR
jgi:hypothetical protein